MILVTKSRKKVIGKRKSKLFKTSKNIKISPETLPYHIIVMQVRLGQMGVFPHLGPQFSKLKKNAGIAL